MLTHNLQTHDLLTLDSSSRSTELALIVAGQRYLERADGALSHEVVLGDLLQNLVKKSDYHLSNLNQIVIGAGPGSFTGLRIGYAFVKGLACALPLKISSYSSLKARARRFLTLDSERSSRLVCVVSDARRGQVYFACYRTGAEQKIEELLADQIVDTSDIDTKIEALNNHLGLQPLVISDQSVDLSTIKTTWQCFSDSVAMGLFELFEEDIRRGDYHRNNLQELSPNYIRAVAAKSIAERQSAEKI